MCQHGHLDTSILAYLGSRGLLTHFEGNGGIFQAKQAIHRGTAMFICYLSFCGQVRKRSGWIDSGMTCIFLLQKLGKNDGSMDLFFFVCKSMEICFIHFHSVSFLETWANGFQPFQTKPLHTISHSTPMERTEDLEAPNTWFSLGSAPWLLMPMPDPKRTGQSR